MEYSPGQRALAEFVGAFTLVFIAAGAILVNPQALLAVALAYGLAVATMVSAVGHVSGGHFNPAVTIAALITQKIDALSAGIYVVAQLAGAAGAALMLRLATPPELWRVNELGVPNVPAELALGQAVLIEAVLTFFLVWVIFGTGIDPLGPFDKIAGLGIGFVVVMDVLMGGPFTGAAMNPARAFGPALAGGFWKASWWVYWVGPIAGAVIAAVTYDALILRREPRSLVPPAATVDEADEVAAEPPVTAEPE